MTKLISTICCFLVSMSIASQNTNQFQKDSLIKGKISVDGNDVDGITVFNLTSKSKTLSSNGGYFIIRAKVNDTIQFTALHIESKNHILKDVDFKSNLFLIQLNVHSVLLKEVTVTNDRITAESLGIIPVGQKKYTVAQRRLQVAKSGIGIDPLFNWLSGRTSHLKSEVAFEEKESLKNKIATAYENEYFMGTLHIPESYINGFLFYIAEDKDLTEAIKIKNKTKVEFRLIELAADYLKLLPINTEK
jgi:hypothetical protein